MNFTTKKDVIRRVAKSWRAQYSPMAKWGDEKAHIADQLDALDPEAATEDEIERIIGNRSWTDMRCDECDKEVDALVQVGQESNYESRTASLCPTCIRAASALANRPS